MTITFCGHSQFKSSTEYETKLLELLEKIVGDRVVNFYLGDYGDFDCFAYGCCKKYQKLHPNVSLIFITPYMTEVYQQKHLNLQKEKFDGIIYPEIEDKPLKFAIIYRNKWMIDKADFVICGITRTYGGAYKTYQYAQKKKKHIFNIATP